MKTPPLAFEFSVALRFLREGRMQSALILAGVLVLSRPQAEVEVSDIHD